MKFNLKGLTLVTVIALLIGAMLAIGISAEVSGDVTEAPVGSYTAPEGAWTPAEGSGVTYAVWANEEDFLSGKDPIAQFTDTCMTTANIRTPGATYLHMFEDINIETPPGEDEALYKIDPPSNCIYKINLGGKTLKTSVDLQVSSNYNTTLTLANGVFDTSFKIRCYNKNTLIFDNVHLKAVGGGGNLAYGLCGNLVKYKDTLIEITGSGAYFYLASSDNSIERAQLIFENTDIITSGKGSISNDYGLFRFIEQADADTKWDIVFDKDSSINVKVPFYAGLEESISSTDKDGSFQYFKKTQHIMFEEGFRFGAYAVPDFSYTITPLDHSNSGGALLPKETRAANDDICQIMIVKPDTYEEVEGELYAARGDDGFYTMVSEKPTENIAWYYAPKGSNVVTCIAPTYVDGIDTPIITIADWQSFAEGATITFAQDITSYVPADAENKNFKDYKNNLTFDLGGYTFYNNYRLVISGVYNKAYPTHWLTMKNGNIIAENPVDNLFYGWPCEDGGLVLEDLNITFKGSSTMIGSYNGNFIFKNCNIESVGPVLTLNKADVYNVDIDRCTISAKKIVTYYTSIAGDRSSIKIANSTLTAADMIIEPQMAVDGEGNSPDMSDLVTIEIDNSYLKAAYLIRGGKNLVIPIHVELSDTYTSMEPKDVTADAVTHKVLFAEGQKLNSVDNGNYKYHVTAVTAPMYTSLYLKSDFTVNFYIPTEGNIKSLTIGDTTYDVTELDTTSLQNRGECYVLPITTVTPGVAAEEIEYKLTYTKDGIDHTANVAYSVLDYVRAVLMSDYTAAAKQMAVAALEYVNAAYSLVGATSDELDAFRASALYTAMLPEAIEPEATENSLGGLTAAVTGARLDLGATMRMRFYLNQAYTGRLTIGDRGFDVTAGKVGDVDYVELELSANALYDTVFTLTAVGIEGEGTYSLADYALSIKDSTEYSDEEKALVSMFYSYCAYASIYNSLYN